MCNQTSSHYAHAQCTEISKQYKCTKSKSGTTEMHFHKRNVVTYTELRGFPMPAEN